MKKFSPQYLAYINSSEWQARKGRALKLAGRKCQICGRKGVRLDVHHNDYSNLGDERDCDLIAVCRPCHVVITWVIRLRRWFAV